MSLLLLVLLLLTAKHGLTDDKKDDDKEFVIENGKETNQTMVRTDYDRHIISRKKTTIIFILLCISFIGGILVTYVNVSDDFDRLQTFYAGYMGRKLFSREMVEEDKQVARIDTDEQVRRGRAVLAFSKMYNIRKYATRLGMRQ